MKNLQLEDLEEGKEYLITSRDVTNKVYYVFKKTCVPNGDKLLGYFQYSDRGAYRKLTEQEILNDLNETKPIKTHYFVFWDYEFKKHNLLTELNTF